MVLEMRGGTAADTTLMVATDRPRTIILRHAPPDNTTFAELWLPAGVFEAGTRDSVEVRLIPRPGVYGVEITADARLKPGAVLTFKYAFHFSAPPGALARYGTLVALEQALFVSRLQADGRVAVLPSTRPAADNLRAVLPADGIYVVAAPR